MRDVELNNLRSKVRTAEDLISSVKEALDKEEEKAKDELLPKGDTLSIGTVIFLKKEFSQKKTYDYIYLKAGDGVWYATNNRMKINWQSMREWVLDTNTVEAAISHISNFERLI